MLRLEAAASLRLINSLNTFCPITSCSFRPVYSSLKRLKRWIFPFWSRITITELASETTCSAKESPCARSRATEGVSFQADAVPAHSFLLILRPTRWTGTSTPYKGRVMAMLEVITVSWRISAACSSSSATTWMMSALSLAARCRALLSAVSRHQGLCVPM